MSQCSEDLDLRHPKHFTMLKGGFALFRTIFLFQTLALAGKISSRLAFLTQVELRINQLAGKE